ncbi:uncharacterized protein VP01_49g4 [Puccinia sorghi]|uniref:Uncharacterized protein n=1 Tax=Puccinia sorghi TaxID=27349 RepID=A0A0L6ULR3_9BASI|nr:uncharacterized protein VP01_49g4 [Puccinia sorghi]
MKNHPTSLHNCTMPNSITHLHLHLNASGVPTGNSAFSRSLHNFISILLGIEAAKSNLPPSPPSSQLNTFQTRSHKAYNDTAALTRFCVYLSQHNFAKLAVSGQSKSQHPFCQFCLAPTSPFPLKRMVCHHDLEALDICQKQWSPPQISDFPCQRYHSKQPDSHIPLGSWSPVQPSKIILQTKLMSAQLSDHCVDTCMALSLSNNLTRIFMDANCTSDTEENKAGKLCCLHLPMWKRTG